LTKFTLKTIEIEGFRGYNAPEKLNFSKPITVLFGRNGVGKSSTLMAIEWCLFGDVAYVMHLEGRSKDELVNQFAPAGVAKVRLHVDNGSSTYEVSRSKKIGSTKTEFKIVGPDKEYQDEEAEQKLFQIFTVTLDDFIRATYLHQESIRGLLVEDTASRDEAMDRLFGLERIRNIIESIPVRKVRENVDDLEQKKASLSRKIEGAVEQCQYDLNRLRAKVGDLGIPEGEITADLSLKISEPIVRSFESLASEYSLPSAMISLPSDVSQIDSFERKVKQALRDYETRIIGTSKLTELNSSKAQLEDLVRGSRENVQELTSNDANINELVDKHGKPEEITEQLGELDKRIQSCETQRNQIDVNSRLVEDAIIVLQTATQENCPVCGQPIDPMKVLRELEEKARRRIRQEIVTLDNERLDLLRKKRQLEDVMTGLSRLFDRKKTIIEVGKSILQEASKTLGEPISSDQELSDAVTKRLSEIETQINEFNMAYAKRAAAFDTIRSDLEKVGAIGDVLKKESEFTEISSHFRAESEEIKQLAAAIAELQLLEQQLSLIVRVAGEVQAGLASKMIMDSQREIESYYRTICNHQAYDGLKVEVRPREVRGLVKNSYSIKAYNSKLGKETFVSTRFSAGQMNSVALSICFALTRVLPLKLGFLILDDPSQSLDREHKEALIGILNEISGEKQLIMATQDEELLKLVQSASVPVETFEFASWGMDGPKIEAR